MPYSRHVLCGLMLASAAFVAVGAVLAAPDAAGDVSFAAPRAFDTHGATSVAIGDLNSDGRPDLAVANQGSFNVSVLLGNGDGTFAAAANFSAGFRPLSVAIGDLNGDGHPDLAVANHVHPGKVHLLFGKGDGTFRRHAIVFGGDRLDSVAIGDLNGDGSLDLVISGIEVLLGN